MRRARARACRRDGSFRASRFSRTVMPVKRRRPSGTMAMPSAQKRCGGQARDVAAVERSCVPAATGCRPAMALMSVVLPDAVRADDAHELARGDGRARRRAARSPRRTSPRRRASSSMRRLRGTRSRRRDWRAPSPRRLRRGPRRGRAPRDGRRARARRASRARRTRWWRRCSRIARMRSTAPLISPGVRPDSTSSRSTSRGRDASARASSRNLRW